jgi:hypothetical protein
VGTQPAVSFRCLTLQGCHDAPQQLDCADRAGDGPSWLWLLPVKQGGG